MSIPYHRKVAWIRRYAEDQLERQLEDCPDPSRPIDPGSVSERPYSNRMVSLSNRSEVISNLD